MSKFFINYSYSEFASWKYSSWEISSTRNILKEKCIKWNIATSEKERFPLEKQAKKSQDTFNRQS